MWILCEDNWFGRNLQMERLTAEVQSVFRELVMQGDWLSSETKVLAESKIQNIVHRFGHSLIFIFDFFLNSLWCLILHTFETFSQKIVS